VAEGANVTLTKQRAPDATLGPQMLIWTKSMVLVPVNENASDIDRCTTLVGQWDFGRLFGANQLVAEVQLAGVSLREVPVPDDVTC
jgi:hypothetical protein